jgi:hypothetical protein
LISECITIDGVDFRPQPEGRESLYLGSVQVGELMPIHYEGKLARAPLRGTSRDRHTHCFRILLPASHAGPWTPARDLDVARWLAVQHINAWLTWTKLSKQ